MKKYYRVLLGGSNAVAAQCFAGRYIAADFGIDEDVSRKLPDDWRVFNKQFIPVFLAKHPEKSNISAGLACGSLWMIGKGIKPGDIVLCANGEGGYRVGEVQGDYDYTPGQPLPHRRSVNWIGNIARSSMSMALRKSCGSSVTVAGITGHRAEIESLLGTPSARSAAPADPEIQAPNAFAMETHIKAFLVTNWQQTILATDFDIYEAAGEQISRPDTGDAGTIDILALSKDGKRLLVVKLQHERASDVVLGQLLCSMGFVKEQIARPDQTVEGMIIALEDDQQLRWALLSVPTISFYRYEVSFRLVKG
jgi:restriction system protein